jgi:predicted dehydrogenase
MDPLSRRLFLNKVAGAGAAATAFTIIKPQLVRGAGREMLKVGLVGCGGRGTQAVANLFTADSGVELVAVGDVFKDKLDASIATLRTPKYMASNSRRQPDDPAVAAMIERIKVDPEHQFVGFDAYKKVIGSGVDIVMLCSVPGYRPAHFEAAVDARKHVFCEKPFGTDPAGVKRFMAAARRSERLNLTVVSGAQRRFARDYQETVTKIHDGAIGQISALYAYWIGTPVIQQPKGRRPEWRDMEWQHRNWYSFVWICGDQIVEQHLHNIDVCNWVMGMHPEKVVASGGAAWRPREELYGNIYDHLVAEFTYPNGVKMLSHCRQYRGNDIYQNVSEMAVGTKGTSNCHDLGSGTGQDVRASFSAVLENPYVREHVALVNSIRGDGPYVNHAMTVAESTMTCIMARESAYSGQEIIWDEIMASNLDLQPKEFDMSLALPVPPLPVPGVYKFASFPKT